MFPSCITNQLIILAQIHVKLSYEVVSTIERSSRKSSRGRVKPSSGRAKSVRGRVKSYRRREKPYGVTAVFGLWRCELSSR